MNRVILESSIDDKLDQIEYMIENENNDDDKEFKEKKKKALKNVAVLIALATALLVVARKLDEKNTNKRLEVLKSETESFPQVLKDVTAGLELEVEKLKRIKSDINSYTKIKDKKLVDGALRDLDKHEGLIRKYQSKINNLGNQMDKYNEDLKNANIENYKSLKNKKTVIRSFEGRNAVLKKNIKDAGVGLIKDFQPENFPNYHKYVDKRNTKEIKAQMKAAKRHNYK